MFAGRLSEGYEGNKYWFKKNGQLIFTPLLLVLLVIDVVDIIFAVDSIPAVLAISRDPFIVYTSNIFAIMGLRSLYFVLAHIMGLFHHLHYGLAVILSFIGLKMLLSHVYHISNAFSLLFTLLTLTLSIIASIIWPEKKSSHV
jgi:tellurite resistance protein TerC